MIGTVSDQRRQPVARAGGLEPARARQIGAPGRAPRSGLDDQTVQRALTGTAPLTPAVLAQLQARAGNAAVEALLCGSLPRTATGRVEVQPSVQRGLFSRIGHAIAGAARGIGHAASSAWRGVKRGASAAWGRISALGSRFVSGIKALGSQVVNWLESAGEAVWRAVTWFGNKAVAVIKAIGTAAFEKLSLLGALAWNFLTSIPERFWRLLVDGWHAFTGLLSWLGSGLVGLAGRVADAVVGIFSWLKSGLSGALGWLREGLKRGAAWATAFISHPSLDFLRDGMLGALGWVWSGIKGFGAWGWQGVVAAAKWAWSGMKAFASWVWNGVVAGAVWLGKVAIHLLELLGVGEALQFIWGLLFKMRKLTAAEISASTSVHPIGLIPYWQVRVDDDSMLIKIGTTLASLFKTKVSPGAITTMHIIHAPKGGLSLDVMVHELTHVAQYELVGAVYMPQALHAQNTAAGYDYVFPYLTMTEAWKAGVHFADLNREQQASVCEDYYRMSNGMAALYAGTLPELAPYLAEERARKF
jgi:hypothetical protein